MFIILFIFGLLLDAIETLMKYHSSACVSALVICCVNGCGGRPLLHEHEVAEAVQTTTQPGNCSPLPVAGKYRSGAIEYPPFRFQVYACGYAGLVPFWRLASHQRRGWFCGSSGDHWYIGGGRVFDMVAHAIGTRQGQHRLP